MTMLLEKKLKGTDLSNYVTPPRERFVIEALRYRNYAVNVALERTKSKWEDLFAIQTAGFYFREIRRYFETGETILSTGYKKLIDKNRNIEALPVDNTDNKRRFFKSTRKKIEVPVKRKEIPQLEIVNNTPKNEVVEKFSYGIRFNGCCIITFENEHEQEMFLKGMEMASIIKDYKKVHVRSDAITEVE